MEIQVYDNPGRYEYRPGPQANLISYIQAFSKVAREIFEYFNFEEFIGQLADANLLYQVVQRERQINLDPNVVSNHDMGLVFEELRRWNDRHWTNLPSRKATVGDSLQLRRRRLPRPSPSN